MDEASSIVASAEPKGKEIVVDSEDVSLATLTVSDTDKSIYVKAYRKWTVANKNGKPLMFHCMFIDRQVLTYPIIIIYIYTYSHQTVKKPTTEL